MNTYNRDLSELTLESVSELLFNKKCRDLIVLYNIDHLIESTKNLHSFYSLFTTSGISKEELTFTLVKRYYLLEGKGDKDLNDSLECLDFEQINNLIKTNPNTRNILIKTYIDNLNTPYFNLPKVKNANCEYDEIYKTLTEMEAFYYKKKTNTNYPVLKKTYKPL